MSDSRTIQVRRSNDLVPYGDAVREMEARVAAIHAKDAPELVWLLEHPPLYTAGTSAQETDLLSPNRFPVFKSGRGGQYTYHGPGQRVAYIMLDLRHHGQDLRCYVKNLEAWMIDALAHLDVRGETRDDRIGIWVERDSNTSLVPGEDKICAIGVRVRRWVSFHGAAINVTPDLEHFSGIIPCGVSQHGVTSLEALGKDASMKFVDDALTTSFEKIFGVTLVEEN